MRHAEIDIKCHAIMKVYPNGRRKIIAASKPIFGGKGWELSDKWDSSPRKQRKEQSSATDILRSKRRAAAKLRDYALCNDFRYFVTLTLDAAKIDRYDLAGVVRKLRTWLDNRVRRCGLKYVLVPEEHKDGAFHFHGFFNDAVEVADSGTMIVGAGKPKRPRSKKEREEWLADCAKVVYNLPDWALGFSTAIELYGDYDAAIGYVSKYITKQGEKLGGRWYFSGGDLKTPEVVELRDVDYYEIRTEADVSFTIPNAGFELSVKEVIFEGSY